MKLCWVEKKKREERKTRICADVVGLVGERTLVGPTPEEKLNGGNDGATSANVDDKTLQTARLGDSHEIFRETNKGHVSQIKNKNVNLRVPARGGRKLLVRKGSVSRRTSVSRTFDEARKTGQGAAA